MATQLADRSHTAKQKKSQWHSSTHEKYCIKKPRKYLKQCHIIVGQYQNGLERVLWHANAFITSTKCRERTREASIDNMVNEDSLLSVI